MATDRLFKTAFAIEAKAQQDRQELSEIYRREEQGRRDKLNLDVQNGLLRSLETLGKIQDRDLTRQMQLAQLGGKAGMEVGPNVTAPVRMAGQVGMAQRQTSLADAAREAQAKQAAAAQEFQRLLQKEKFKSGLDLRKEQFKSGLEREETAYERELTAPDREFDRGYKTEKNEIARLSAEKGPMRIGVNVAAPNPEGWLAAQNIPNLQKDYINNVKLANQIQRGIDEISPESFNAWANVKSWVSGARSRLGFELSPKETKLIQEVEGSRGQLSMLTLQIVKPMLGVLTGADIEVAKNIVGQIDAAVLSSNNAVAVKEKLRRIGKGIVDDAKLTHSMLKAGKSTDPGELPDFSRLMGEAPARGAGAVPTIEELERDMPK